jgi:soluble lytic murein transglycosylase
MHIRFPIILLGLSTFLGACNLPAAALPTATVTPRPAATATLTLVPTATWTPLPTPTPLPVARIGTAANALFNGDYSSARQEYEVALGGSAEDAIRREALWGLARADFEAEEYPAALEQLRQLLQTYPGSEESVKAVFLQGETLFQLGRYSEAAAAYQEYLAARPGLLDAYIQERRGDCFLTLPDYSAALAAYQAALVAPGEVDALNIRLKIANTTFGAGEYDLALGLYDEIFAASDNDYLRAQMDFLAGRALIALNRHEEGYLRWQHAVENYPLAYDSYSALVGLVDANQPVDDYHRGLVDYFAGQYGVALASFDRYIEKNPDHDGSALHYKALTLREMGETQKAVEAWTALIEKYPDSRFWASSWDERAYTQWAYLDQFDVAAAGLEQFSREASASEFALPYLLDAARIRERGGQLEQAASLWESLPNKFPTDTRMGEALFQAGLLRFRLKQYPAARQDFQNVLQLAAEPWERARALLWVGKTYQVAGDLVNARTAWRESQAIDLTDYYSLRARDLLEGRAPFAAPPSLNLAVDLAAERRDAEAWLRVRFSLPPETDLSNIGALGVDPRLQRGTEFWQMGLYDQARIEFEDLRASVKDNAADSFRLGNYLLDLGAYRSAIFSLREVLTLAGLDDHSASLNAPAYFKHVRYGFYYADLIWPAAAENAIDPLLVTSIIRQESLFEGFVRSEAGARGLMQIIPATGESLATQIGWPAKYTADDLYSPAVSIRFGSYYFAANRRYLGEDTSAALAAYNGGPGNAAIWQSLANGDSDLFLEVIRYAETRDYIRHIYEIYAIYRGIYSPVQ